MNVMLTREADTGKSTLGKLSLLDTSLESLERPWLPGPTGGVPGQSCIPIGTYQLVKHDTEAHPRSFALVNEALGVYHYNVPLGRQGRTACLIHIANRVEELRGCIALGMSRVKVADHFELRESKKAIDAFYAKVPWIEGHTLTIQEAA